MKDNKELIKRCAKDLLLEGRELQVRPLAELCGISVGTIYNSFPTLDDLVLEMAADLWREANDVLEATPPTALADALTDWMTAEDNAPLLYGLSQHPSLRRVLGDKETPCVELRRMRRTIIKKLHQRDPALSEIHRFRVASTITVCFRFFQLSLVTDGPAHGKEFDFNIGILRHLLNTLLKG